MELTKMSKEELINEFATAIDSSAGQVFYNNSFDKQAKKYKKELLSRLEAGEKAIESLQQDIIFRT